MKKTNPIGIVIVAYNNEKLISKQAECIGRFCKDRFEMIVVDNSTNVECSNAIKYHCTQLKIEYIKTNASSRNGSDSHAFAANLSYILLKDRFRKFFYLDHDCFPVKEFSVNDLLSDRVFAGLGQQKSELYIWPGCLMFDNTKVDQIDFSPNHKLELDTGGNLYKEIAKSEPLLFNESYEQNPAFVHPIYGYYSMIHDGTFMHFINSSNWNTTEGNESRVNSLLNILEDKIK